MTDRNSSASRLNGGVLILAAGSSRRFGRHDKRRATLGDGNALLESSVRAVSDAGLPYVVCLAEEDRADPPVEHVPVHYCGNASLGMGATLAGGIDAVLHWDYALVALGDMPWIQPTTFRAIAGTATREHIVIPVCAGRRGHPVAFGAELYSTLQTLTGDSGARKVVEDHAARVRELTTEDTGIYRDVDIPADLAAEKA